MATEDSPAATASAIKPTLGLLLVTLAYIGHEHNRATCETLSLLSTVCYVSAHTDWSVCSCVLGHRDDIGSVLDCTYGGGIFFVFELGRADHDRRQRFSHRLHGWRPGLA